MSLNYSRLAIVRNEKIYLLLRAGLHIITFANLFVCFGKIMLGGMGGMDMEALVRLNFFKLLLGIAYVWYICAARFVRSLISFSVLVKILQSNR